MDFSTVSPLTSGGDGSGSEQSGGPGQPQGDDGGGGGGGGSRLQGAALASQALVLLLIFVLSSLGNSAVIAVIAKHRQLRTVTNAFIVSLSLSDLLAALLCLPFAFLTLFSGGGDAQSGGGGGGGGGGGSWPFGDRLCVANAFFNSCSGIASALTMALISLDRYCAIARRPRAKIGRRLAARLLAGVWVAAAAFSSPWYLLLRPRLRPRPRPRGFYHCTHLFHSASSRLGLWYGLTLMGLGYLLPFALMCFCHYRICQAARLSERRVRPLADSQSQALAQARPLSPPPPPPRLHGETRTATTVLVMIVLAICCRGPYCVAGIVAAAASSSVAEAELSGGGSSSSASPSLMDAVAAWMAWANGAINPLIYAARNPDICLLLGRGRARGRGRGRGRESGYRTRNLAAYLPGEGEGVRQSRRGQVRTDPGQDTHKDRYQPDPDRPGPGDLAVWACRNPALLFCRDGQRDTVSEPGTAAKSDSADTSL